MFNIEWVNNMHGLCKLVGRVFANRPGGQGSEIVLDTSLLNRQHYKVRIKCKVEQFRGEVVPSSTPR